MAVEFKGSATKGLTDTIVVANINWGIGMETAVSTGDARVKYIAVYEDEHYSYPLYWQHNRILDTWQGRFLQKNG